jgi:hypothetical protein
MLPFTSQGGALRVRVGVGCFPRWRAPERAGEGRETIAANVLTICGHRTD